MARTALVPVVLPKPYDMVPLALPFVAADAVNFNSFPHTGKQVLIAFNSDVAVHNVTAHSVADSHERVGDSVLAVPAGEYVVFQEFPADGWRQADGNIWVDADNAAVKLAVITLP